MSVESVRAKLGSDAELVTIEEIGKVVKVAFKEYIHGDEGKKAWNRVNNVVKEFDGVWVSEGRLSRWQIPVSGVADKPTQDKRDIIIKDLLIYAENVHKESESVHKQSGILVEKLKELQS